MEFQISILIKFAEFDQKKKKNVGAKSQWS